MTDENLQDGRGHESLASASSLQQMTDPYKRTIEQELDSLEREALKNGEYVGITNALALRLVAESRATRTALRQLADELRKFGEMHHDDRGHRSTFDGCAVGRCFDANRVLRARALCVSEAPAKEDATK